MALTTGSPEDARNAAAVCGRARAAYLDAGVQAQPETIGTSAARFLYSGSRTVFDEHRTTLELLGIARYLGAEPGAAAVHDLALFGLWYDAQVALLRAFETVRAAGIDVESFASLAAPQLRYVVDAAEATARELATGLFPRGPADLTEHAPVLERLVRLRRELCLGDGDLDRIRRLVQQRIERGRGHEGFNSILAGE